MSSPNEPVPEHTAGQPATAPATPPVIIPGYTGLVPGFMTALWLEKRRRHEAAHAVVAHERGGIVRAVVAGGPEPSFGCDITWPELTKAMANVDWLVPDSVNALRVAARKKIACLVAGHLSETDIDNNEQKISQRTNEQMLINNRPGDADRDQIINLLNDVNLTELGEITEAEADATAILVARVDRLNAIIDHLQNDWRLNDGPLVAALNL